MPRNSILSILVCALPALLSGCGSSYVLQGKAIRGEFTTVSFVSPNDSRLYDEGVANCEVYLYRDPDTLGRKMIARGVTDDSGTLRMPVSAFGTGWMEEQWLIWTYRPGMQSVSTLVTLPEAKDDQRLLLILGPGIAEHPPQDDELMRQYEHFK